MTQEQSYNPETDMNIFSTSIAEPKETVYIAKENGELFSFQKETATAAFACSKSGCEHNFVSSGDGFYQMPVDNPKQKEQLIALPEGSFKIKAYGSYVYFQLSKRKFEAFARYNIESEQIEQFTDMTEQCIHDFLVNDGKIYFTEENAPISVIFCYDTNTGKKEPFLPKETEQQDKKYSIEFADLDYIYITENIYGIEGTRRMDKIRKICAYTWDGGFAGEVYSTEIFCVSKELKPFEVFHYENCAVAGIDSDRIYYIDEIYDTQVDKNGTVEKLVEGTGKTIISYIYKFELSTESGALQKHTAGIENNKKFYYFLQAMPYKIVLIIKRAVYRFKLDFRRKLL